MQKVNTKEIVPIKWSSPKGKFVGEGIEISEALGRKPRSTDLLERHPFDVEVLSMSKSFGSRPERRRIPITRTVRSGSSIT
jgi:hypothetical protein